MTMQNAIRFLRDFGDLEELRRDLCLCEGYDQLFSLLAKSGYKFTGAEFEEVVDHIHVACQTADEAELLMEKATWFRMVAANA